MARKRPARVPVVIVNGEAIEPKRVDEFAEVIKENEAAVLESLGALLDDDNETAAATAAIKIIDAINDKGTPEVLRVKLMVHKQSALQALIRISTEGSVASARANAGAYLLKVFRANAPASWPPEETNPEFRERLRKAREMCQIT